MRFFAVLVSLVLLQGRDGYPNRISLNLNEFLRLRCSLNPEEEVFTTWKGSVYLHAYQRASEHLFDLVGMNVARCLLNREQNEIILTSRECQLYLDPSTGQKVTHWLNPYTQQNLSVVHVANDPVQNAIPIEQFTIDGWMNDERELVVPMDVNLLYPNPLYDNETLRFYSKEKFYQAGEYFKFFTEYQQVSNASLSQVKELDLSWTRISPFLPWMNVSQLFEGSLIYSAQGTKVTQLSDVDPVLVEEIVHRLPLYQHAPSCQLNGSSETSWTYFKKYFSLYLSHEVEFPVPKSSEDLPCVVATRSRDA